MSPDAQPQAGSTHVVADHLDRQAIERRDFPVSRRGYDTEVVDAHLSTLADRVEELERQVAQAQRPQAQSQAAPESIAVVASKQVQAIVAAAEASAAGIEEDARNEADRLCDEAAADAEQTRIDALVRSRTHVGRVDEATTAMLERVGAMEGELQALSTSLRTGATRLTSDLAVLQENMGELYDTAAVPSAAQPATPVSFAAVETVVAEVEVIVPDAEAAAGAHMVALDLALSGTPRDETRRCLEEHYDLEDYETILDEVYDAVER